MSLHILNFRPIKYPTPFFADDLEPIAIKWLKENGHPGVNTLCKVLQLYESKSGNLVDAIQKGIDRANIKAVSNAQKVQRWVLLEKDFSMAMNELTPTLKMKRSVITKKYENKIDSMYS